MTPHRLQELSHHDVEKEQFVKGFDVTHVMTLGNGNNDRLMLRAVKDGGGIAQAKPVGPATGHGHRLLCADLQTDARNCGTCGNGCDNSQSCHAGQCSWDLVAACLSTGQIVGVSAADTRGPLQSLGTGPITTHTFSMGFPDSSTM